MIVLPTFHGFMAPAPASGAFDPLSLSPDVWLDFSDSTKLFNATTGGSLPGDGVGIGRVEDKGALVQNFTETTAASRPTRSVAAINGHDVASFLATSSQRISRSVSTMLSGLTAQTIVLVHKVNNTGAIRPVFYVSTNNSATVRLRIQWLADDRLEVQARTTFAQGIPATFTSTLTIPSGYMVLVLRLDHAARTLDIRINSSAFGSATSFSTAGTVDATASTLVRLGATGTVFSSVDIAEFYAFRRILTGTEGSSLEAYLLTRYGIS